MTNAIKSLAGITLLSILIALSSFSCTSNTHKTMNTTNTNPLLCDPEKGSCEVSDVNINTNNASVSPKTKPVKVIYFTDPICSSCWGIEPQLRKLKLEYGKDVEIEYRMGGLLKDWTYNSGGISKPSDVAHHWDEVSKHYDMPIDGDVWLEDPLNSSYPPSIAFKAAQIQDEQKALKFLRRIREMVFLEKKNITKWEYLSEAAKEAGLDVVKFKSDYDTVAKDLFQSDLDLAKNLGVRGFPTLYFIDSANHQEILYGYKPYETYEHTLLKTYSSATKEKYDQSWQNLFSIYPTLTTKEFSVLSGLSRPDSEVFLEKLTKENSIVKTTTKNGAIWKLNKP